MKMNYLSPAEAQSLQMADGICKALFGPATARETAHSIMADVKAMTSVKSPAAPTYEFDYTHQAWLQDGRYVACGHKGTIHPCKCYGTLHEGELPAQDANIH